MKKLLVVDDDFMNRDVVVDVLMEEWKDCEVLTAPNGRIGLEIAKTEKPEIILLDWEMPEMNGLEMLHALRKHAPTKDIPVVMYTGIRTESNNLRLALEAGANEFLRKPMDPVELIARINSIILQWRLVREKAEAEQQRARVELEAKEKELVMKKSELTSLAFILEQKELFVRSILSDVQGMAVKTSDEDLRMPMQQLLRKLKHELNSEKHWEAIRVRMNDIHSGFLSRLLDQHPDLTKSELKLCSLMKLNLSRKEAAEVLHISVAGVEKRRYRLRKKLGLDPEAKMENYIHTFSSPGFA